MLREGMGLLLICSTILIQCDRNIRGSACRKSSCVSAPRIFCQFTLTTLTSSMIHSHRQTPIWSVSVFNVIFFRLQNRRCFFLLQANELSQRLARKFSDFCSSPPFLHFHDLSMKPFSRLSVVVHAILQLRNLRFCQF